MKKYWLKHKLIPCVAIGLLIALINVLALFFPAVNHHVSAYNSTSIYDNTEVDFVVPSPGIAQISELEALDHIRDVTPYYFTKSQVRMGEKSFLSQGILMFEVSGDLEKTIYTQKRLIEYSIVNEEKVFVDFSFAKSNGVKLGDKLNINLGGKVFDFTISAIYENNPLFKENTFVIRYSDSVKQKIEEGRSKPLPFSGAYIISDNQSATATYLKNDYKPMALLKGRDEFDTDSAYEVHKNGFYAANYANQIEIMEVGAGAARLSATSRKNVALLMDIAIIVVTLILVIGSGIMMLRKDKPIIRKSAIIGVEAKNLVALQFASCIAIFIVHLVGTALLVPLGMIFVKGFFSFSVIANAVLFLGLSFISHIIFACASLPHVYKYTKRNYQKKK